MILLLHDWGAVFGYEYARAHPQRVRAIIGVDVGDSSEAFVRALPLRSKMMIAAYQLPLALAWYAPRTLGTFITQMVARQLHCPTPAQRIHAGMNMPYAHTWRHGGYRMRTEFVPHCPMLFVYGTRKPLQFFQMSWLRTIAQLPHSQVLAMPCGHWPMVSCPEAFNDAIGAWLTRLPV